MVNLFQNNSIRQKRYQELSSIFIKIAPENPVLWTGFFTSEAIFLLSNLESEAWYRTNAVFQHFSPIYD